MIPFRKIRAAWTALCLAAALAAACAPQRRLPNIVLITVDTLRADRLGCYGYFRDTTPVIDALAQQSVLFENALTHMGTTLPAHLSLLTSTRTIRHGVRSNEARFDSREIRTFAEMLGDLGYTTAAFVSCTPLKSTTGVSVGFQHYSEPEGADRSARETTDKALAWLADPPGGPFFLWVHYFDPHKLHAPPPPYDEAFETDDEQLRYLRDGAFARWKAKDIQRLNNLYDGEIFFTDGHIGRLLRRLREMEVFDDAAVVFAGDHGESMGQHGWLDHGKLYGEILRVPLLIKMPGLMPGAMERRLELTALVDVLPTLVEELDLPLPETDREQFDGRDALGAVPREDVLSERVRGRSQKVGKGDQFALTADGWRYYFGTEEKDKLFHLATDSLELHDVLSENEDVASRMRERIGGLLAGRTLTEPLPLEELPPDYVEELRALGYVE